jgi:hypothetical protein
MYDESSKGPSSTSQTQPTRVYVPPNAGIQSGLNPSPAAMAQQQQHGSAAPGQLAPVQLSPQARPPQPASGSLRIVLWFIVFAVVGFGIVATLHHFKML